MFILDIKDTKLVDYLLARDLGRVWKISISEIEREVVFGTLYHGYLWNIFKENSKYKHDTILK
jgi:hypothetical protein